VSTATDTAASGLAHWPADTRLSLPTATIGDLLRSNARRFAEHPALYQRVGTELVPMSYAALLARVENVARWLAARTQVGDRIGVWSRNCVEFVLVQHACALAGLIIAPFNTGWTDAEVEHALSLTSPALAFAGDDNRGHDLHARLAALASCPVEPLLAIDQVSREPSWHPLPQLEQGAPFLIQFTSGTTGRAKGALLSHRAALLGGWLRPHCEGANEHDVWLNAVPYHHIGGSCAIVLAALTLGASFVVLERYDCDELVRMMGQINATRMGGVPTMWHDILSSAQLPSRSTVKTVSLGGASVPPHLVRLVYDRLGARCGIGYGQSEFPIITATMPEDPRELVSETVGRPLPHIEMKIVDPNTGATVPFGVSGEICLKGPLRMEGYWNNPEATHATIDADGFLHTGDLGSLDAAGYCRINGRLRDLIIRGGENIYPAEIEAALLSHPAVAMAAVVGVHHPRLGQDIGAVVKLKPAAAVSNADLEAHAARSVAHFKVPRHWRFVESMPTTVSGKIRKVELEHLFK
jgi:fatty-acyl-CoA synthase